MNDDLEGRSDSSDDPGTSGTEPVMRALEERLEIQERLLGIVSHDLRTPLNTILTAAAVIQRRPDVDERLASAVRYIVAAGNRAERLVSDLMDFTQTRYGASLSIQPDVVDVRRLIRNIVEEARLTFPSRELLVDVQDIGSALWDADRIHQALINLLRNAVAYSPAGSAVHVAATDRDDIIELRVTNQSEALPAELMENLFEPMKRLEGISKGGGLGLGLYIVKQIAIAHGGTVVVESAGAEISFAVRLPRRAQQGAALPIASAKLTKREI